MRAAICLPRFALMPVNLCDCAQNQRNCNSKYIKESLKNDSYSYKTSAEGKITTVGFPQAAIFQRSSLGWTET